MIREGKTDEVDYKADNRWSRSIFYCL